MFDSEEDMLAGLERKEIAKGTVVVIRYEAEGRPGHAGDADTYRAIMGAGLGKDVALLTDGLLRRLARLHHRPHHARGAGGWPDRARPRRRPHRDRRGEVQLVSQAVGRRACRSQEGLEGAGAQGRFRRTRQIHPPGLARLEGCPTDQILRDPEFLSWPSAHNCVPAIFLSYRRSDSVGAAGRLFDRLAEHFGADQVFRDIDSIEAGENFEESIRNALRLATVVLVVIGPRWLEARSQDGARRIDDPADYVRREIETALSSDAAVVPCLSRALPCQRLSRCRRR